jgi:Phytanoyl-CoA dioxygenase (PhyH)
VAPSLLSQSEIKSFRDRGMLKLDFAELIGADAFEKLANALRDAEAKARAAEADGRPPPMAPQPHNGLTAVKLKFIEDVPDGYTQPMGRMCYLSAEYPDIQAVVKNPRVGEVAARLAGVPHVRTWVDETFFKRPNNKPVPWHQDLPVMPMDRKGLLTFWVAIEDVTEDMGPVEYLEGSNHLGPLGRPTIGNNDGRPRKILKNSPYEFLYEGDRDKVGGIVSYTLRAGQAVVHDGLTLHGSGINRTDRVRRGFTCVFFPSDTQYTGMPRLETDGLSLQPFNEFNHPRFAIVA